MSEARDAQHYFEVSPPGNGWILAGALGIALGFGIEAASTVWQLAFVSGAVGMHLLIRGVQLKRTPGPRVSLSELGITDARGIGGPIAWNQVRGISRKSLPKGEHLVYELKDGRTIQLAAADFKKHDFDRMQSFSLLYQQRYG